MHHSCQVLMNNLETCGTVFSHLPFVNLWYLITFDVYTKYMKSGVSVSVHSELGCVWLSNTEISELRNAIICHE
jgi:hypothetical protein